MSQALATLFESASGEALDEASRPELEARLGEVLQRSRRAWPGIEVDEAAFVRHLAERLVLEERPAEALVRLCGPDLYLACGCALGIAEAATEFDSQVKQVVPQAVRRIDSSAAFAGEVTQLTVLRLLVAEPGGTPRIAGYQGRGSLRGWIQVAAVRIALDLRRQERPEDTSDERLADSGSWDDDPELQCVRLMYRGEFTSAFQDSLGSLSVRERNVLRMSVLDHLNIDQIGAVYRVHRSTVARWISRSHETLLTETRKRLVAKLSITETEFESLMVAVRSHLDLSLDRFLK